MGKFNNKTRTAPKKATTTAPSFIKVASLPTGHTYEGAPGYSRDPKSELFLLALSTFVKTGSAYETALVRDPRFKGLIHQTAVASPQWTKGFLWWLRNRANMRSAAMVGGLEAAAALLGAKVPGGRQIVRSVIRRPDEPTESIAYWFDTYGEKLPKSVKRGVADAIGDQYTEFNWLKYDGSRSKIGFAEAIQLTHAEARPQELDDSGEPIGVNQNQLFKYILEARYSSPNPIDFGLTMVTRNVELRTAAVENPLLLTDPRHLERAGFTWEDALSLLGVVAPDRPELKVKVWEAVIDADGLGYMAMLRNLRNLSEVGISAVHRAKVISRLVDPGRVAGSKQFPFRFLSAFKATKAMGHEWRSALETALQLSLLNVPKLPGKTLILVDVSGSMGNPLIGRSYDEKGKLRPVPEELQMPRAHAAAIFGGALAIANAEDATLVAFDDKQRIVGVNRNTSLLGMIEKFQPAGGTYTKTAVMRTYKGHDRVVIITDEQAHDGDPGSVIPSNVPLYTWDLGGYEHTSTAGTPNRHWFGGLTDHCFKLIPLLEAGKSQRWPWEGDNA